LHINKFHVNARFPIILPSPLACAFSTCYQLNTVEDDASSCCQHSTCRGFCLPESDLPLGAVGYCFSKCNPLLSHKEEDENSVMQGEPLPRPLAKGQGLVEKNLHALRIVTKNLLAEWWHMLKASVDHADAAQ